MMRKPMNREAALSCSIWPWKSGEISPQVRTSSPGAKREARRSRADSVSRELYASALRLARNRGLLETADAEAVQAARHEFLAEVMDVLERLSRIDRLEGDLLEEVLG